jgi:tetratricopeptide (TPR) repeat protein
MYLRTPKRYTKKGMRRNLLNLRWLWLYLLAPVILIPSVLAWQFRDSLGGQIGDWVNRHVRLNEPTPTATIPAQDFQRLLTEAFTGARLNRAIELLKQFTAANPNETIFHPLLAELLVLRGAYSGNPDPALLEEAYQAGQRAINANPEGAEGWTAMALVLDWSSKPQEALPYVLRAQDLDPEGVMVQAVLAEIYHDLQKDDLAQNFIDNAMKSAKNASPVNRAALAHAYYVKARILQDTGADGRLVTQAYEDAWRVATSDPPDPTIPAAYIVQFLQFIYSNADQVDRAIELVTKAIQRDRDDPLLPYFLSRLYFRQGDANKALNYAQMCHDLDARQPGCVRMLGTLYYREQNYKLAAEMYQQLADQGSKVSSDYLYGGQAYRYLNQCNNSISILQRGIAFAEDAQARTSIEDALRLCNATAGFDFPTPAATATVGKMQAQPPPPK